MESINQFLTLDIVLIATGSVLALYVLISLFVSRHRVLRKAKSDEEYVEEEGGPYPSVSVIVTCVGWSPSLRPLIESIFNQEYDGKYEVIVVNVGRMERTEYEISELQLIYKNLYLTFSPGYMGRHLALTVGIKAAKYEYVLLTEGNVKLNSNKWLELMCRHFRTGKNIVSGVGVPYGEDGEPLSRMQTYDYIRETLRWTSSAIGGKTLRASRDNIGYRKDLFYKNNGFPDHQLLMEGDDDIFVSQIGKLGETAVELSEESIVHVLEPRLQRDYNLQKQSRILSNSFMSKWSLRRMGSLTLATYLWLIVSVVAIVFCHWRIYVPIVTGCTGMLLWWFISDSYRRLSILFESRRINFSVPWLMLIHPLYIAIQRRELRQNRDKYFVKYNRESPKDFLYNRFKDTYKL